MYCTIKKHVCLIIAKQEMYFRPTHSSVNSDRSFDSGRIMLFRLEKICSTSGQSYKGSTVINMALVSLYGVFSSTYCSSVVIYDCRAFIRLTTGGRRISFPKSRYQFLQLPRLIFGYANCLSSSPCQICKCPAEQFKIF